MRVAILSQTYFPEPDPKMQILAAGLVERGHTVTTITAFPNYPAGKIYPGYRQRPWQREKIDGVEVVRLPIYPDRSRSPIRRSANYLSFPAVASLLGPVLSGPMDVLLVYHPPLTLGIPAWIISRLRRAPFVFEIQDMWPETLPATGMVDNAAVLGALARLGTFVYRKAAAITVISPGFRKNLIDKGVAVGKIHVFPNWAYEGMYETVARDDSLAREFGLAGRFNVMYAGNFGPAQDLDNVLKAAVLLRDLPEVQFVLLGDGVEQADLETAARTRGITNVRFIPRQPMRDMPSWYAWADALLVHLRDDPLFAITIPGKTQSSLASGRPVIACVRGDAADLVLEADAGLAAEPSNPKSLADAVRRMRGLSEEQRAVLGAAGRRYYREHLAPDVLIGRYERLLADVVTAAAAAR